MGGAVSIGVLTTLACTGGATACVASGAGAMGGGGKEYGECIQDLPMYSRSIQECI